MIVRLLTDMTLKYAKLDFNIPSCAQRKAFDVLKRRLTTPLNLALRKHGRPYTLDCDASAYQLGCTLVRGKLDGRLQPVGY